MKTNATQKIAGSNYVNVTVDCPVTIGTSVEIITSRNAGLHMSRYGDSGSQVTVRIRNLISSDQTGYGVNIIRIGY